MAKKVSRRDAEAAESAFGRSTSPVVGQAMSDWLIAQVSFAL